MSALTKAGFAVASLLDRRADTRTARAEWVNHCHAPRIIGRMKTAWLGLLIAACGPSATSAPPVTPANTAAPQPATAPAPADGLTVGTASPTVVEAVARDGSWLVVCQARTDDDGDGEVAVNVGMHGDTWGDTLRPYLVRGSGDGEAIDLLIGRTRDDRWVTALRQGKLALLDTRSGTWTELAGADLRDDGMPLGPHRAASLGGARMTYFRNDDTIAIRDLETGAERSATVKGAKLWRVEVQPGGDWALVFALRKDTDGDGKLTWPSVQTSLSGRGCRGPISSYSTGGWDGDRPDELWLELATATIAAQPPKLADDGGDGRPDLGSFEGRAIIAIDRAGRRLLGPADSERGIPVGPLRWVEAAGKGE